MIVKTKNNTLIIKFKYETNNVTKLMMHKQRQAISQYETKSTVAMVRLASDSVDDYVSVRVKCSDDDQFVKAIGRELAFIKLLRLVINDADARKAAIEEYNRCFPKHKVDESKIHYILNLDAGTIVLEEKL